MESGLKSVKRRRIGFKPIPLDELPVIDDALELVDIDPKFKKYVSISDDYSMIKKFTCPVEGCGFQTDQGPGALRMHILIAADPKIKGRYCSKHEIFLKANPDEMTLEGVNYLA